MRPTSRMVGISLLLGLVVSVGGPTGARLAYSETYPAWPVRVVVPFSAGGTSDLVGRVVARELTDMWHQQVIADSASPSCRLQTRISKLPR